MFVRVYECGCFPFVSVSLVQSVLFMWIPSAALSWSSTIVSFGPVHFQPFISVSDFVLKLKYDYYLCHVICRFFLGFSDGIVCHA